MRDVGDSGDFGRSFGLDVRVTNDAPVVVILLAKECAEVDATDADRRETLADEFCLDIGRQHSCSEPSGQSGEHFLRRFRRREQPPPQIDLETRIACSATVGRPGSASIRVRELVARVRKVPKRRRRLRARHIGRSGRRRAPSSRRDRRCRRFRGCAGDRSGAVDRRRDRHCRVSRLQTAPVVPGRSRITHLDLAGRGIGDARSRRHGIDRSWHRAETSSRSALAEELEKGELVILPLLPWRVRRTFSIVRIRDAALTPPAWQFLAMLRAHCRQYFPGLVPRSANRPRQH